ncbi:MAG: adenosylhomocysteinase [Thermaerobacter sp.]|nr:adenosylhomocysteinase [Thermaerobacter sp.]
MSELGARRIAWADEHMPILGRLVKERAPQAPLRGQRVGMALHLEAKTARLALALQSLGAEVAIAGSNPLSTQDAVARALAEQGVTVHARHGANADEYFGYLDAVLAHKPTLVIDDGGDLLTRLHLRQPQLLENVRGAAEETTTGLVRLRAMHGEGALRVPVIAVNDAQMKRLFDNRFGTGQSVVEALMGSTNLTIAGRYALVVGFGQCGRGVAQRLRGLGARVGVVDIDPVRMNEAWLDGYEVGAMAELVPKADIVVTVTGALHVVRKEHFEQMRDGVLLANAGHFDVEIDKNALREVCGEPEQARENVERYTAPDGRRFYLLGEGRLVNLAAGDGHPAEIMDLSFAVQALALLHLTEERMAPGVHAFPEALDQDVARLSLQARGISLEQETAEQARYRASWHEGTA